MPIRPSLELEEALASYEAKPSDELAHEIERLGREASGSFEPPRAETDAGFQHSWLQLVHDPVARTWCLETLHDRLEPGGLELRIAALRQIKGDPRILRALI